MSLDGNIRTCNICYFYFSLSHDLGPEFLKQKMEAEGFLPKGVMERLIAKTVASYRLESLNEPHDSLPLYQNYAKLLLGPQLFRLICLPDMNCIRVDIEGDHPQRVRKWVKQCLLECVRSLHVIDLLTYDDGSCDCYLSLECIRAVDYDNPIPLNNGEFFNVENARRLYGKWLNHTGPLESYDIFISYRWGPYDSALAQDIYERLFGYSLGSSNRHVKVFRDVERINAG